MPIAIRSLAFITLATTLVACGSKPPDGAASANASAGSSAAATAGGSAAASGDYHGVALYPGMTVLTTNDIGAGPGGTLHSGNFRSTDAAEKIVAFYRDALTKQFGAAGDMPGSGDGGMYRIVGTNNKDTQVTVLVRAGDSGEQIVGIQVTSTK
jgi:hypothetical protein